MQDIQAERIVGEHWEVGGKLLLLRGSQGIA